MRLQIGKVEPALKPSEDGVEALVHVHFLAECTPEEYEALLAKTHLWGVDAVFKKPKK